MSLLFRTHDANPGIGGTYCQSKVDDNLFIQFANSVPRLQIAQQAISPTLEVVGLGTSGLYVLDVDNLTYGEILGHCYSWTVEPSKTGVSALDNRRFVRSDLNSTFFWNFQLQDWSDFVDAFDVSSPSGIAAAAAAFSNISSMEEEKVIYRSLIPIAGTNKPNW